MVSHVLLNRPAQLLCRSALSWPMFCVYAELESQLICTIGCSKVETLINISNVCDETQSSVQEIE